MDEIGKDKSRALKELGVPEDLLVYPLTGAKYLESVGSRWSAEQLNGN
jgi:hypothetical protein